MQLDQLQLVNIEKDQLPSLKFLLVSIFPVRYSTKYFLEVLENEKVSFIAYYKGNPIACLCSKRELDSVLLTALGVLPVYRRFGIASLLLELLISTIKNNFLEVKRIYLHVQIDNSNAIKFYKKHSFFQEQQVLNYYATSYSLAKKDAILFSKQIQE